MTSLASAPLPPSALFEPGIFDNDSPFQPISDPALAKMQLADWAANLSPPSLSSSPFSDFALSNCSNIFEDTSLDSPAGVRAWDPLQQQQHAAMAALLTMPGLSPASASSSYTCSPPTTPNHSYLHPFDSPTRIGALRSPSSAGARYSPIGTSPSRRRPTSTAHREEVGTPRMRRATVGPAASYGTPSTPKAAAAANACIPEPRARLAPPPPSTPLSIAQGPVNLVEALAALELLDAFMQERLAVEAEGGACGLKLVTHEGFHAIEQLRGRVAATVQMEKLKVGPRGRQFSLAPSTPAPSSSGASDCASSS